MRLIHFTAADGWRGHEQQIVYLAEAFRDFGLVEEQWIICRNDSIMKKVAAERGLNALAYDFKSEYDMKFAKKIKNLSNELKADLIVIHSSKAHTISVLSSLFFGLKTPLVLCRTLIEKIDTNFFRKWKYNYPGIKKIICISDQVVNILKPAIKDHNRLRIVGSLTDVEEFAKNEKNGFLHKEFNIPPSYKIIGNVSAFVPVKDHVTWVNAVEILVQKGIKAKYLLVGDGPLEDDIKKLVNAKGLQDDVIFAGFRQDVPKLLPEFDLFLFTSNNEATGGVILEAYASHVPSVAANAAGIPGVLLDDETGFLAEVGNANDFAEKTVKLLQDEKLQKKFTTNGYNYLLNNFTKEIISKKMFAELNEVHLESKNALK